MRIFTLLLFIGLSKSCAAQTSIDLSQHQWKDRVLLFFVADEKEAVWQEQRDILNTDPEGITERDLIIYRIEQSDDLWRDYGVENDEYIAILVGKDGTEKLRQLQPLRLEKLYGIIDQMPMRRREMREQQKHK